MSEKKPLSMGPFAAGGYRAMAVGLGIAAVGSAIVLLAIPAITWLQTAEFGQVWNGWTLYELWNPGVSTRQPTRLLGLYKIFDFFLKIPLFITAPVTLGLAAQGCAEEAQKIDRELGVKVENDTDVDEDYA